MNWSKDSIVRARTELNLSQRELAEVIGCRQQTVSEWELGLYEPKSAYQKLLTDFFEARGVWSPNRIVEKTWAKWVYENEDAIESALKTMVERLPASQISKYERALDAKPKEWK